MNTLQLSKREKKLARELIEKDLTIEYENGIEKVNKVITQWKSGKLIQKEAYLKMYDTLINHDNKISKRYDYMSGSKYIYTVAELLADGIISKKDIEAFNDDTKQALAMLTGKDDL